MNLNDTFNHNSLKSKIWFYLIIFSVMILSFLWLFQIIFLDIFYEKSKVSDIISSASQIKRGFAEVNDDLTKTLDDISTYKGICIQVIHNNEFVYDSSSLNRGCISRANISEYQKFFVNSLLDEATYKVVNPRFDNKVLLKALKLDDSTLVFLSSSIEPLDNAIKILQKQLIIITIVVLILSFVIAYFISKRISKPIEDITKSAKQLSTGNYDIKFTINDDIYELKELVNTLNDAAEELNKTEVLRRELLANVSHDLKTPLTMIKAYAEMVRDITYKDKGKREENLNVIIEESDRLNALVNDILDLSIIQSGNINLNIEDFNFYELLDSIINHYKIYDCKFTLNCDKEVVIKADKMRLEQVMYNLINNAINYSDDNKEIIINVIDKKKFYRVEVIDNGKGIKEEDLKLIFKKYYKVDKTHRRDKVGTGIGLSIVENIFKEHKFNFGVNSKVGEGTTFYFEVPKGKL